MALWRPTRPFMTNTQRRRPFHFRDCNAKQEGEEHLADVAAAEAPQLCPTPCDPTDGSPPGRSVPGFSRQEHWNSLPFPSPETPGVTGKFGLGVRNEAGQRLKEFCQENTLVIANTLSQQHKRRLYTWTSPDGQHWNQIDYILCSQRWRSSIQSAKTRLGADCGSDHELLIAKFRLKLKKVGKTTRPFRYDLNQIP